MNEAGLKAVEATAHHMAFMVDDLLGKRWSRRRGEFHEDTELEAPETSTKVAACACGSGIPVQTVVVEDQAVPLIALPLIFEQFRNEKKQASSEIARAILEQVKIYNEITSEQEIAFQEILQQEYYRYCSVKDQQI